MTSPIASPRHLLLAYYGATVLFLLLDILFDLNVRIAFFEASIPLRAAYYAVCFACLALMLWRPNWTAIVSAFESLVTLVALIVSFGVRTILISDATLEGRGMVISVPEIVNFLMSGAIAYIAWTRGMRQFRQRLF
ncbi:MAG: hypothetical protein OER97_12060 [Gammaproteobacteria bacterium]|nr:hypothetical protein [Gammaproteobacteria bacterium]